MSICTVSNSAKNCRGRYPCQFLRTLTCEDVDNGRLLDLGGTSEKFVTMRVGGFDADNNVTIAHGNMPELDDHQERPKRGHGRDGPE